MNHASVKSFVASIAIHLVVLFVFLFEFKKRQPLAPEVSLVLEARIISPDAKAGKDKKNLRQEMPRDVNSPHVHHHFQEEQNSSAQKLLLIHQPLPDIPEDLRYEAFNSEAVARFHIAADGEVLNVELIKPCANPRLNQLLLKSLKKWKFESGSAGLVQDIRVTFRVE